MATEGALDRKTAREAWADAAEEWDRAVGGRRRSRCFSYDAGADARAAPGTLHAPQGLLPRSPSGLSAGGLVGPLPAPRAARHAPDESRSASPQRRIESSGCGSQCASKMRGEAKSVSGPGQPHPAPSMATDTGEDQRDAPQEAEDCATATSDAGAASSHRNIGAAPGRETARHQRHPSGAAEPEIGRTPLAPSGSDAEDALFAGLVSAAEIDAEALLPFLSTTTPPPGERMESPRGDGGRLFGPAAMVFLKKGEDAPQTPLYGLASWASVHSARGGSGSQALPDDGPEAMSGVPFSVDDLFTGSIDALPAQPSTTLLSGSAGAVPRRHSVASIFSGIEGRMAGLGVSDPASIGSSALSGGPIAVPALRPAVPMGPGIARSPPSGLSAAAASFHYAPRHYSLPRVEVPAAPAPRSPPVHLGSYRGALYAVDFKAGRTELFYVAEEGDESPRGLAVGEYVIVEADRGEDLGRVVAEISARRLRELLASLSTETGNAASHSEAWMTPEVVAMLRGPPRDVVPKRVHRRAGPADLKLMASKAQEEAVAMVRCQARIRQKRLPMDVVDAEYQWDRNKLTFYFCAERRIDFRELVRDLFRVYKTRIWMCAVDRSSPRAANYVPPSAADVAAFDEGTDDVFDDDGGSMDDYGAYGSVGDAGFGYGAPSAAGREQPHLGSSSACGSIFSSGGAAIDVFGGAQPSTAFFSPLKDHVGLLGGLFGTAGDASKDQVGFASSPFAPMPSASKEPSSSPSGLFTPAAQSSAETHTAASPFFNAGPGSASQPASALFGLSAGSPSSIFGPSVAAPTPASPSSAAGSTNSNAATDAPGAPLRFGSAVASAAAARADVVRLPGAPPARTAAASQAHQPRAGHQP